MSRGRARLVSLGLGLLVLYLASLASSGDPVQPAGAEAGAGPRATGADEGASAAARGGFGRRNPFRIVRIHPPPAPPAVRATPAPRAAAPPPTPKPVEPPPVTLVGTIAGGGVGFGFLRDLGKGGEVVVQVGSDLGEVVGPPAKGWRVVEVRRNALVLANGGRRHVLEVGGKAKAPVVQTAAAPAAATAAPAAPPQPGAAPAGPERELARSDVEAKLRNLGFLITQLNVQPFYRSGKPAGFRVSRIRPGSFVDQLGARNGDIIQQVNGRDVTTVKDAFLLYNSFKTQERVEVKVLRGGREQTMRFRIR